MKKFLVCCMFLQIIACSDKFETMVRPVTAVLSASKDTLYLRERDYTNILNSDAGKLTLYCGDASHQLNLQRDDTSQAVHVSYRGISIAPGDFLPVDDSLQVFVSADLPGLYALRFFLTDRLGKANEKTMYIRCLANQPATPSFFYRMEEQTQPQSWPYYFDASLSSKPDGIITQYHYQVNGQIVESRDPLIHWIFRAKGEHLVNLSVTDDLGQRSATYTQKIKIP